MWTFDNKKSFENRYIFKKKKKIEIRKHQLIILNTAQSEDYSLHSETSLTQFTLL